MSQFESQEEIDRFSRRLSECTEDESKRLAKFRKNLYKKSKMREGVRYYPRWTKNGILYRPEDEFRLLHRELDSMGVPGRY